MRAARRRVPVAAFTLGLFEPLALQVTLLTLVPAALEPLVESRLHAAVDRSRIAPEAQQNSVHSRSWRWLAASAISSTSLHVTSFCLAWLYEWKPAAPRDRPRVGL